MIPSLPESLLTLPLCHRGYHDHSAGIIENSPAAFSAAIRAGYGIELDIQLSQDGQAMVFHDHDLEGVTDETGPLQERTAEALGRIRLRGSTDTIPTLAQTLALVAGRAPLLIELKDQSLTMSPTNGALEVATAQALAGYGGPVALMSYNPDTVARLAALAPHLPRGLVTGAWPPEEEAAYGAARCAHLRAIADYDACRASFISHDRADLNRPRVAELKARGAAILTWTVRSLEQEIQARRIADNITFESYPARIPA